MKELPILFSAPMVRAILDGQKTQTRRCAGLEEINQEPDYWQRVWKANNGAWGFSHGDATCFAKPRYQVGDVLWCKETYWVDNPFDGDIYYKADWPDMMHNGRLVHTKPIGMLAGHAPASWHPGLFMPKKYARLWLRVTDVRAQRLQDITEADAVAEGLGVGFQMNAGWPDYRHIKDGICELSQDTAVMSFATLWGLINGKTHPWESNPWGWTYSFERIEKP